MLRRTILPALSFCLLSLDGARLAAQYPITWAAEPVVLESAPSSWTTLLQLTDGSWLAAYMVSPSPDFIRIKRSFDRMRTWQWVAEIHEDGRDLDNPRLYMRPDGVVLITLRSVINAVSYRIEVYQSQDNGNSFQSLSVVDSNEGPDGLFEPSLATLPDGSIAAFYSNETHRQDHPSYNQIISERVSHDNGATWGSEIFAIAQPGQAAPGEPNMITFPDCPQVALFYEICVTENCLGHVSFSTDGLKWTPVGPPLPDTFQDIQALLASNGLVFAISNSYDIIVTPDDATTWIDTNSHPFSRGTWPSIAQTSENEIAVGLTAADPTETGEYIQFGDISQLGLRHLTTSRACGRIAPDLTPCKAGAPCNQ